MIKSTIRKIIRIFIRCRSNETIEDCISRHKSKIMHYFYKTPIEYPDLRRALIECGITSGDNIVVHCAWREFYNFKGSPNDVIDLLREIVGVETNISMPCYGSELDFINLVNSKSNAGVLSEVFRMSYPVNRSACAHFSMAVWGPDSLELVKDHNKSTYGFDFNSPYYRCLNQKKCKIVLLGLGKRPKKLSLIHVAEYINKDYSNYYRSFFDYEYDMTIEYDADGKNIKKMRMRNWAPGCGKLIKRNINKLYTCNNGYKHIKISNLNIITLNAYDTLKYAEKLVKEGERFTK